MFPAQFRGYCQNILETSRPNFKEYKFQAKCSLCIVQPRLFCHILFHCQRYRYLYSYFEFLFLWFFLFVFLVGILSSLSTNKCNQNDYDN